MGNVTNQRRTESLLHRLLADDLHIDLRLAETEVRQPDGSRMKVAARLTWSREDGCALTFEDPQVRLSWDSGEAGRVLSLAEMWSFSSQTEDGLTLSGEGLYPDPEPSIWARGTVVSPPTFSPWAVSISGSDPDSGGWLAEGLLECAPIPEIWHGEPAGPITQTISGAGYELTRVRDGVYAFRLQIPGREQVWPFIHDVLVAVSVSTASPAYILVADVRGAGQTKAMLYRPQRKAAGGTNYMPFGNFNRTGLTRVIECLRLVGRDDPRRKALLLPMLLLEASFSTVDVQASIAAIVLEGMASILGRHLLGEGMPSVATPQELDKLRASARSASLSPELLNRVNGVLGMLGQPGGRRLLHAFSQGPGAILSSREVDTWSKFRNKALHGEYGFEHVPLIHDTTALWGAVNKLFLAGCGFSGKIQDISEPGWPEKSVDWSSEGLALTARARAPGSG